MRVKPFVKLGCLHCYFLKILSEAVAVSVELELVFTLLKVDAKVAT